MDYLNPHHTTARILDPSLLFLIKGYLMFKKYLIHKQKMIKTWFKSLIGQVSGRMQNPADRPKIRYVVCTYMYLYVFHSPQLIRRISL
jgi:hypothetical protein